jgi:hypothetical protein
MARRLTKERGAGQPKFSLTPTTMSVTYGNNSNNYGMGASWFGPLEPLRPIAPPEVAGRQLDYPMGLNIQINPKAAEAISFQDLRALADSYDLLRIIIETRKDQIERMAWSITHRDAKTGARTDKDANAIQLENFFRNPDRRSGWALWLRMLLEDLFVIDAPAIYCERTRGGKLISLQPIDGATIKRVVDDWGRTPIDPNAVAYQQVLKGYPAIDYTSRDLVYRPRNMRPHRIYGYSPVEQIIMTVNIALRRQLYLLQYFTEGNIPEALIGTPDNWTPEQIVQYQNHWDQLFVNNTGNRRHAKFVPGGIAKTFVATKEPELKSLFDEWLAKIVCFAFSTSSQPFTSQVNRATAETQKELADEEGLAPIKQWVKTFIDDIITNEFGQPDFEFAWGDDTQTDPVQQEVILTGYVTKGIFTINEARDALGREPSSDPNANVHMTLTPTGFVPLDAFEQQQQAQADQAQAMADAKAKQPVVAAPGGGGKGAEKVEKRRLMRARRPAPVPFARPATRRAIANIRRELTIIFGKARKSISRQVISALHAHHIASVGKAADDDPDEKQQELADKIAEALDLSDMAIVSVMDAIGVDLAEVAKDAASEAIAQIGPDNADQLTNQVYDEAVDWARERAAELVGMRWSEAAGTYIENPNAEYAITDTTREAIRAIIANGLEDNIGIDGIAQAIEDWTGFSEDRADLIANTEVRAANSEASVAGYKAASDSTGLHVMKEWLVAEEACDICQENADEGPIELDDDFPSDDNAPPGHPNCRCAVSPVVISDGEGDNSTEGDVEE